MDGWISDWMEQYLCEVIWFVQVFTIGRNTQGQCGVSDKKMDVIKDPQKIALPEQNDKIIKVRSLKLMCDEQW